MGGVAVLDPVTMKVDTPAPPAIIEEFRLAGVPVRFKNEVVVPANTPAFEIHFSAPTFVKPEQVRFRYRFIELDQDWIDAGDRRSASFYRIPPGKYHFEVTASNPEGSWNPAGQSLTIIVQPPFWRTWWFAVLAFVASASGIFAAYERRARRFRQQNAIHAAFSRQLIDSQENERRRISNEIHDSLGIHAALIKKRAHEAKEIVTNGQMGTEFDDIVVLADQIRSGINEITRSMRPVQLDIIGLSKTIQKMFEKVGTEFGLEISTAIDPVDDVFPAELGIHIYRIVQESMTNILKHSKATRADLAIVRKTNSVQIKIDDNGQGFNPEPFKASGSTGFGLMNIRERARMLNGSVEIRSVVGSGTSIIVNFVLDGELHG
jgi:signal transduction histidine kinase